MQKHWSRSIDWNWHLHFIWNFSLINLAVVLLIFWHTFEQRFPLAVLLNSQQVCLLRWVCLNTLLLLNVFVRCIVFSLRTSKLLPFRSFFTYFHEQIPTSQPTDNPTKIGSTNTPTNPPTEVSQWLKNKDSQKSIYTHFIFLSKAPTGQPSNAPTSAPTNAVRSKPANPFDIRFTWLLYTFLLSSLFSFFDNISLQTAPPHSQQTSLPTSRHLSQQLAMVQISLITQDLTMALSLVGRVPSSDQRLYQLLLLLVHNQEVIQPMLPTGTMNSIILLKILPTR